MAYYSRFEKSNKKVENFFRVLIIVLCSAFFIYGIVAVVDAFQVRDGFSKINLDYSIGEIVTDSTGAGVVSTDCGTALYSDKAVKCTGFYIRPSFSSRVDYEVHFYTDDNIYVGFVTSADESFAVDVGEMPVLKTYVGDLTSPVRNTLFNDAYNNADVVLDADGNEQVASYIRIVIRAIDADEDIFENVITRIRFGNDLEIKATTRSSGTNA